ncbi:MAG: hypothetical protein KAU16_02310 [Methanophagales archaeon]|nr:hypothetical protein [Methanophagales archaeon]
MRTERNVIYFPYMRVPENEWFTRVLLYWDNIYAIVPTFAIDEIVGDYMGGLMQEGLIITIDPDEHIRKIPRFSEAFLEWVDAPEYPVPRDIHTRKRMPKTAIHTGKLEVGIIGNALEERGLADFHRGPYAQIESYTADLYMAYLAANLGQRPIFNSTPITDKARYLASFAAVDQQKRDWDREFDEMRTVVLNNILPAPSGGVPPREIADFKRENKTLLKHFRNKLESVLLDAAPMTDLELRKRKINQFIFETQDKIDEISEALKARNWNNITPGRFLGYSITGLTAFGAVLTGGLIPVVIAALSAGKTLYDVYRDSKPIDIFKGNYAAYAVMAQRKN